MEVKLTPKLELFQPVKVSVSVMLTLSTNVIVMVAVPLMGLLAEFETQGL